MNLVNFFVIGAPKCGTTSLHDWLTQHPELDVPARKELFYFDYQYELGLNWYHSHFNFGSNSIKGDFTPTYLYSKEAIQRIYDYNDEAKILVVLRDPVGRFISHYYDLMNWVGSNNEVKIQDDIIIDRGRFKINFNLLKNGQYSNYLKDVYSVFPKGQVKILFFEEIIRYPSECLGDILNFIGVKNSSVHGISFHQMNKAGRSRSLIVNKLLGSEVLRDFVSKLPLGLQSKVRMGYQLLRRINTTSVKREPELIDMEFLMKYYEEEYCNMSDIYPQKVDKYWAK